MLSVLTIFCLVFLSISFSVSAVYEEPDVALTFKNVTLPFPNPNTFGNNSCAIVFRSPDITVDNGTHYNEAYEMFVFSFTPEYMDSVHDVIFSITKNSKTSKISFSVACSANVGTFTVYRFWYYPSIATHYSLAVAGSKYLNSQSGNSVYTFTTSLYNGGSNARNIDNFSINFFGECGVVYGSGLGNNRQFQYTFMGEVSPQLILNLQQDFNQQLSSSNNKLDTVILYSQKILSALNDDDDFTTSVPTSNEDLNNYQSAEDEMLNSNFDSVNNVSLPDVSTLNTGNYRNAFGFLSSNIEFLSGNGSNYGDASNSMAKVGVCVFVILGLGLASFVIGLVNRRKE